MKGFRVLLVEDEPNLSWVLSRLIAHEFPEIEVTVAATYKQAVDEMQKQKFDMLITDYQLPDGNGNQVAAKFDEYGAPGAIRIGMSGGHIHLFHSPEITFTVQKPFPHNTLDEYIILACKLKSRTENDPDH